MILTLSVPWIIHYIRVVLQYVNLRLFLLFVLTFTNNYNNRLQKHMFLHQYKSPSVVSDLVQRDCLMLFIKAVANGS